MIEEVEEVEDVEEVEEEEEEERHLNNYLILCKLLETPEPKVEPWERIIDWQSEQKIFEEVPRLMPLVSVQVIELVWALCSKL